MRLEEIYTICVESKNIMEEIIGLYSQWIYSREFRLRDEITSLLTEFFEKMKNVEALRDEVELCEKSVEKDISNMDKVEVLLK